MQSLRMLAQLESKENIKTRYEGWKLLLAVRPDQVEAARKCVFPLLRPYGCYHTWSMSLKPQSFTIISLKRIGLEISRFAQPEIYVTPTDVAVMVRQIEGALKDQGIGPDDPRLAGFAKTCSPYFFLANLNFTHSLLVHSLAYKQLLEKEGGFNPLNTPNPYQSIMENKRNLEIAECFSGLPKPNKEALLNSLQVALLGFLRAHTHIDDLNEEEQETFTRECFQNKRVNTKFIKKEAIATEQDIKTAKILFEWALLRYEDEIILNPRSFSVSTAFSNLIDDYNHALRIFSNTEDNISHVTLDDFLQSQCENLAERWMLADCGVFKGNDGCIQDKIKGKLPDIIAHNDCDEFNVAIKKLKKITDIHFYHNILLSLKRHALVQVELADLLINDYDKLSYERPLTYKGLTFLKAALRQANPETAYMIVVKVEKLWKDLDVHDVGHGGFFAKKQKGSDLLIIMLKELVIGGCSLAKFIMARFLCRDLNMNGEYHSVGTSRRENVFDHTQAETYFSEVAKDESVSEKIKSLCRDYLKVLDQIRRECGTRPA